MLSQSLFVSGFSSKQFVFKIVIALFVIVAREISAEFSLNEGDICTFQKLRGTCKRLQKCPHVYQQTLSGEAPEMVCNFADFEPIVCCFQESARTTTKPSTFSHNDNFLTTSTTVRSTGKTLTNQDLPGQVAQRKCSEYSKAVYTLVRPPVLLGNVKPVNKSLCGVDNKSQKLIVGGTKSGAKEFPHMAAIGYESENQEIAWNCGGTLISERFVLTAAHCSFSSERGNAVWARVGDLNLEKSNDDARPKNYRIVERIKHPNYKELALYHDIALMKLEKDVQFNAWVRPACLPDPGSSQDFEMAIATGWGRVDWSKFWKFMHHKFVKGFRFNQY